MSAPKLQRLVAFVESAANGGFSAAARRLDLTPAAVSKSVQRLEDELGLRLFKRSTRQLRLTPEGERFLAQVAPGLRQLDEAVAAMAQDASLPRGRVRISAPPGFGRRYVLPCLPSLAARHPQLDIELSLENRKVDLIGEGFDIGVRGGPLEDSGLVARRVARLPLVLVASSTYLRRHGAPPSADALSSHQCIGIRLDGGAEIPWRFRRGGRSHDLRPRGVRLWLSDPEAALDLALAHGGIAQVGLHHAMPGLRSGRLKAVLVGEHDPGDREIAVHYAHRHHLAPRVRVVVDALVDALAGHDDLQVDPGRLPGAWVAG
ncbi:MAG: LysR substrate-binding domain-containing protein [Pseudomonadota bacterium]|jgi:DNA-binding transcriptional LysR family regulator